jgi:two-component system, NarL family, response regulator DevR
MSLRPPRALLVGGHPVIVGVAKLACEASGVVVVGERTGAEGLAEAINDLAPDVVVIDLELPDVDGVDLLRETRSESPGLLMLAVSDRTDGATVLEAMRVGADGYLTKPDGLREVGHAIRRLVVGERVLDPAVEAAAVSELGRFARRAREGSQVVARLSPREREILLLLADGLTMQQIGRRLGISPRTVESHVSKLYRKLAVRTRVQAIARAAALGLIDLR